MSKKTILWTVIIVLAVVLVWILSRDQGSIVGSIINPTASATPSTTPPGQSAKATPKATPNMSYVQAVATYKDTRVQFNDTCHAIPGQIVLKNGTKVMLDNRSADAKTLTVAGKKYTVAGYGWKVITATTDKSLPFVLGINCQSANSSVGNALTINIQAKISDGL